MWVGLCMSVHGNPLSKATILGRCLILLAVLWQTWWSEAGRFIQMVYFIRAYTGLEKTDKLSDMQAMKTFVPITEVCEDIFLFTIDLASVILVIANQRAFFKWLMLFHFVVDQRSSHTSQLYKQPRTEEHTGHWNPVLVQALAAFSSTAASSCINTSRVLSTRLLSLLQLHTAQSLPSGKHTDIPLILRATPEFLTAIPEFFVCSFPWVYCQDTSP